jgi:hypothetical protein
VWTVHPSIHPSIPYGVLVAVGSFLQGIIQSSLKLAKHCLCVYVFTFLLFFWSYPADARLEKINGLWLVI